MRCPTVPVIPGIGRFSSGSAPAPPFVNDTFTDTNGVLLDAHVGETGATWTLHPSYTVKGLIAANRWRANTDAAICVLYASGVPPSADYTVTGIVRTIADIPANTSLTGVCGRMSTVADTFYTVYHLPFLDEWRLYKWVAGTPTQLGASFSQQLVVSTDYTVALVMAGTTISAKVDGVTQISVTDAAIAAAGRVGVRASGDVVDDNTGLHLASISAGA